MPFYLIAHTFKCILRQVRRQEIFDKAAVTFSYDIAGSNDVLRRDHG